MTVMLRASQGGYNPRYGWTGQAKEKTEPITFETEGSPEADDDDPYLKSDWQTIAEHTDMVVSAVRSLLEHFPNLEDEHTEALLEAARYHDVGKAHAVFQEALLQAKPSPPDSGALWAKCAGRAGRYRRKGFRHELASAMVLLGLEKPDLVAYLAAAHHGKVRLSIRSLPHESQPEEPNRRFARGVWEEDMLGPVDVGESTVIDETVIDLSYMELGETENGPSWTARALSLRDDPALGPMRLAYMEALLRVADWRASQRAGRPHAQGKKETRNESQAEEKRNV
jgi:CRISPR-associated endonuclease/helicase Cas3